MKKVFEIMRYKYRDKKIEKVIMAVALFLVLHGSILCQTDSTKQFATLSVRCNQPNVKVFDDSLFLGIAPLESLSINIGTHIFCYVLQNERSWLNTPVVETVIVHPNEHVVRNVELPPLSAAPLLISQQRSSIMLNGQHPNNLPLYISSSAAVAAGIAAAFFKIRADNYYADYQLTGNQGRLGQVRRLDTASGIALAVSEASLFWLTYTLLSR